MSKRGRKMRKIQHESEDERKISDSDIQRKIFPLPLPSSSPEEIGNEPPLDVESPYKNDPHSYDIQVTSVNPSLQHQEYDFEQRALGALYEDTVIYRQPSGNFVTAHVSQHFTRRVADSGSDETEESVEAEAEEGGSGESGEAEESEGRGDGEGEESGESGDVGEGEESGGRGDVGEAEESGGRGDVGEAEESGDTGEAEESGGSGDVGEAEESGGSGDVGEAEESGDTGEAEESGGSDEIGEAEESGGSDEIGEAEESGGSDEIGEAEESGEAGESGEDEESEDGGSGSNESSEASSIEQFIPSGRHEGVASSSGEGVAETCSESPSPVEIVPLTIQVSNLTYQTIIERYNARNYEIAVDAPNYKALGPVIQDYIQTVKSVYNIRSRLNTANEFSPDDRLYVRHKYYRLQLICLGLMNFIRQAEIKMNLCVKIAKIINGIYSDDNTSPKPTYLTGEAREYLNDLGDILNGVNLYLYHCKSKYREYKDIREDLNMRFPGRRN